MSTTTVTVGVVGGAYGVVENEEGGRGGSNDDEVTGGGPYPQETKSSSEEDPAQQSSPPPHLTLASTDILIIKYCGVTGVILAIIIFCSQVYLICLHDDISCIQITLALCMYVYFSSTSWHPSCFLISCCSAFLYQIQCTLSYFITRHHHPFWFHSSWAHPLYITSQSCTESSF